MVQVEEIRCWSFSLIYNRNIFYFICSHKIFSMSIRISFYLSYSEYRYFSFSWISCDGLMGFGPSPEPTVTATPAGWSIHKFASRQFINILRVAGIACFELCQKALNAHFNSCHLEPVQKQFLFFFRCFIKKLKSNYNFKYILHNLCYTNSYEYKKHLVELCS